MSQPDQFVIRWRDYLQNPTVHASDKAFSIAMSMPNIAENAARGERWADEVLDLIAVFQTGRRADWKTEGF